MHNYSEYLLLPTYVHVECGLLRWTTKEGAGRLHVQPPLLQERDLSGYLAGKVWLSNLESELKPLAASLADIANDDGSSIYPSVGYMAWRLGVSRSTVDRHLSRLRELGVLCVVSQGGGRTHTTEYELNEHKLPQREPWKAPHNRVVYEETTSSGDETTSPVRINHVTAVTLEPSIPVIETSVGAPLSFPKPQKKAKDRKPYPQRGYSAPTTRVDNRDTRTWAQKNEDDRLKADDEYESRIRRIAREQSERLRSPVQPEAKRQSN